MESPQDTKPAAKATRRQQSTATATNAATTLKVLTWNIAVCKPSHAAPPRFQNEAAILQAILQQDAHVLCLQECPSSAWKPPRLVERYANAGAVPTHCGVTQLWVHKDLLFQSLPCSAPSVAAVVLLGNGASIGVSSSHLAPFKQNAPTRLEQVTDLHSSFANVSHCIHAGDFNMRKAEDADIEVAAEACDAWKTDGSN